MSDLCIDIEEMYLSGHLVGTIAYVLGIPTEMVVEYIENFMMEEA
jgi:hypothetical protein